jgi:hypothetical protein
VLFRSAHHLAQDLGEDGGIVLLAVEDHLQGGLQGVGGLHQELGHPRVRRFVPVGQIFEEILQVVAGKTLPPREALPPLPGSPAALAPAAAQQAVGPVGVPSEAPSPA